MQVAQRRDEIFSVQSDDIENVDDDNTVDPDNEFDQGFNFGDYPDKC